jgi:hypothetical protein
MRVYVSRVAQLVGCLGLVLVFGAAKPTSDTHGLNAVSVSEQRHCLECYVIGGDDENGWDLFWGGACDQEIDPDCSDCIATMEECRVGGCCWMGPPCDWLCGASHDLRESDFEDPERVVRAMRDYPDAVKWNALRGAIQVVGCSGDIVSSIRPSGAVRARIMAMLH